MKDQNINIFDYYPGIGVKAVEITIAEIISTRMVYPFKPTQIITTKNGFYAW